MKNYLNRLESIAGTELKVSTDLSKFTTIRLQRFGDILIVKNVESLVQSLGVLHDDRINYHLIGWGANQIIHNTEDVLFIKLQFEFQRDYLDIARDEYLFPASVSLNILTSHAKKFGLKGWEVFTGVPASLGGAIFMNAGTNLGEIKDIVKSVKVLRKNRIIEEVIIDEDSFFYRGNNIINPGDVIISAKLIHHGIDKAISQKITDYLELRKRTQPLKSFNCGCVFKNFDTTHRAGQYIDVIGFKGLKYGDLEVSMKHANFIENTGKAKSEDFLILTNELKYQLELFTGIEFELEAKVY